MGNFNTPVTENSKTEWLTPPAIIKSIGDYNLDPCSPIFRPWDTARAHFDINVDGMSMPWFGRVWLNPPYGEEMFVWMTAPKQSGLPTRPSGYDESVKLLCDSFKDGTYGQAALGCLFRYIDHFESSAAQEQPKDSSRQYLEAALALYEGNKATPLALTIQMDIWVQMAREHLAATAAQPKKGG